MNVLIFSRFISPKHVCFVENQNCDFNQKQKYIHLLITTIIPINTLIQVYIKM